MRKTCIICGVSESITWNRVLDSTTAAVFSIVRCDSCGLGKTEPQPLDLAPFYPVSYYGGRHGATASFCLQRRIRVINREMGTCKALSDSREKDLCCCSLLDVGCGDGSFLLAAKARGWTGTGLERFPDDARAKGLDVFADVSELKQTSDFDCITLWHSLEHIAEPFKLLEQLSGLIKPGGRIIVAVPDFGGWQARLFGRFWLHLDVPRHLWHFTLPALRGAFKNAGLDVVQSYHQEFEYDLLGWSQSASNAIFKIPNVFFNWLTKKPTGVGNPMLVVQIVFGFLFSGLSVPLVWLGSAFKRGGTVIMVGVKHV
jgi:SAM-dependent methyltransferase